MNSLFFLVVVAIFAFMNAQSLNTTQSCGGNCPGGCDSCPCGTTTQALDIAGWCAKYSGWNQASCQCIVKHESGGNGHAVNQNSGSASYKWDVGLWQVNSFNWASCNGGNAPCDGSSNLACAIKVFNWGGNTWKNWSTCGACGNCNSK